VLEIHGDLMKPKKKKSQSKKPIRPETAVLKLGAMPKEPEPLPQYWKPVLKPCVQCKQKRPDVWYEYVGADENGNTQWKCRVCVQEKKNV
jgi:hypothetical protein